MTWGTQLVEGAHLTGGDTRFCRESSRGVKTQPPAGNKHGRLVYVRYYSSLFTFTESLLHLRNFVANLALSRLRTFGAAPLAEIWWQGGRGHKNILTDRVKSTRKMITIKFRDKGRT